MSTSTKQINLFTNSNNAVSVGYKNYNAKKCLEQLNKFDRITTHIKIFSKLLIEQNSWFSKKCKLSWRLKGTSFSRIYIHFYSSILNSERINNGLLPTPQAMDVRSDTRKPEERSDAANKGGCSNLREWAANGMLPTPRAANPGSRPNGKGGRVLNEEIQIITGIRKRGEFLTQTDGINSQLNPLFVAEMMGFPPDWTELPFINKK